ncbi:MAG: hypothetical protein AAF197_10535 [Pseudomonadota bacterium]
MKKVVNAVVIFAGLVFSVSTFAGAATDNANLTSCKTSIENSIEGVERIKVANIKSKRGSFTAKFRVTANGERSKMECLVKDGEPLALSCVSGAACETASIVAN